MSNLTITTTKLTIVRRNGRLDSSNMKRTKLKLKVGCCQNRGTCPNSVKWIIDKRYFCMIHAEAHFERNFVEDMSIVRLDNQFKEEKPSMSRHTMQMSG